MRTIIRIFLQFTAIALSIALIIHSATNENQTGRTVLMFKREMQYWEPWTPLGRLKIPINYVLSSEEIEARRQERHQAMMDRLRAEVEKDPAELMMQFMPPPPEVQAETDRLVQYFKTHPDKDNYNIFCELAHGKNHVIQFPKHSAKTAHIKEDEFIVNIIYNRMPSLHELHAQDKSAGILSMEKRVNYTYLHQPDRYGIFGIPRDLTWKQFKEDKKGMIFVKLRFPEDETLYDHSASEKERWSNYNKPSQ